VSIAFRRIPCSIVETACCNPLPRFPGSPVVGRLLGSARGDTNVVGGHGTMWDNPELAKIAADFLE
jgi:hypothetical protein